MYDFLAGFIVMTYVLDSLSLAFSIPPLSLLFSPINRIFVILFGCLPSFHMSY